MSGYLIILSDSRISWKSKKEEIVSLSLAETEYRSIRKVVGELTWLHRLLIELTLPIKVYCDSQSAIHIAHNPVFHKSTKHIEIDCHFARSKLQEGLIYLNHISTNDQLTDILTRPSVASSTLPYLTSWL